MCSPALTTPPCCIDTEAGCARKSNILSLAQRREQEKVSKHLLVHHTVAIAGSCVLDVSRAAALQVLYCSLTLAAGCRYLTLSFFNFRRRRTNPPKQRHTGQPEIMVVWEIWKPANPSAQGLTLLFIFLCSELWEYSSSQLCITAGHREGTFHNPFGAALGSLASNICPAVYSFHPFSI